MRNRMMLLVLSFLMMPFVVAAQGIPNGDFEEWANNRPVSWYVNNEAGAMPFTQTDDAYSGSSALRGEVISFFGSTWPPAFFCNSLEFPYIEVSERYNSLTGYYKFAPAESDVFCLGVVMLGPDQQNIGGGFVQIEGTQTSYSPFTVNIEYAPEQDGIPAAYATIAGAIGTEGDECDGTPGENVNLGSYFIIDALAFEGATAIEAPEGESQAARTGLMQNYPNPFNPRTTISYRLAEPGPVSLTIYNAAGQHIKTLVDGSMPGGEHQITWDGTNEQHEDVGSGVYYYELTTGEARDWKRMVLLK